jgi:hypothetical protein
LPKGRLSTRYLSASAASGNGKVLATFPGFVPKRLRLSKDREALDAGPLPDQIGDIDGGLTLGCITKCRQTSTNRKRCEGLAQGSAPDAVDHKDECIALMMQILTDLVLTNTPLERSAPPRVFWSEYPPFRSPAGLRTSICNFAGRKPDLRVCLNRRGTWR